MNNLSVRVLDFYDSAMLRVLGGYGSEIASVNNIWNSQILFEYIDDGQWGKFPTVRKTLETTQTALENFCLFLSFC
ncbi:MAG: hypothetical protein P5680_04490 [Limnospira sp. PMC 737.11]|uniref:hypothetical protein n=1 Tax=Limnospira sp. PMC 737.11 TaxID=2981095 RepID=UPI0028E18202|nr:hypothetical protein [Limnospira sp. PMC 737.11]MDT9273844.1 hypothetical protein [Limnospira sp. PMC 737.11]